MKPHETGLTVCHNRIAHPEKIRYPPPFYSQTTKHLACQKPMNPDPSDVVAQELTYIGKLPDALQSVAQDGVSETFLLTRGPTN